MLHHAFDGVVERIAEQRIQVGLIDEPEFRAIHHAGQGDVLGFAVQRFFRQHHVEHTIAGLDHGIVDHHRPFHFAQPPVGLRVVLHGAECRQLVFEIMTLAVDQVDRLLGDLILPLLALP